MRIYIFCFKRTHTNKNNSTSKFIRTNLNCKQLHEFSIFMASCSFEFLSRRDGQIYTFYSKKKKKKSSVPVSNLPELTYFEVLSSRILLGFIYIGSNYLGIEVLFAYFNVVRFILGWVEYLCILQYGAFYD